MKTVKRGIRKLLAGLIGFPLLGLGIVLIPLPGPGVLISLLAFFVLSLEFDWAQKYLDRARGVVKEIWRRSQERAARFEEKHASEKDKKRK